MALRHNNELSMWQCKRCGSFWHGEPPERGGTPCECTRPQAPEPLPVPTPSQQKQKRALEIVVEKQDENRLTVSDFDIGPLIGSGGCSKVFLTWLKGSDDTLALKVVDKKNLFEEEQQDQVANEKEVLALAIPFCNRLYFSFQDDFALYLVMDYCPGGDLFDLMKVQGPFDEQQTSVYLAEVVSAVDHLHKSGFLHRDLKPENFLIDFDGHLKLGDFGFSRPKSDPDDGLVIGSLHYIAPEVIDSVDYSMASDWWSVGIMLFEMVIGEAPFPSESEQEVLLGMFDFRGHFRETIESFQEEAASEGKTPLSAECIDLITQLCNVKQKQRLGSEGIMKHAFFKEIDWSNMAALVPPFKPALVDKLQFALSLHGGSALNATPTKSSQASSHSHSLSMSSSPLSSSEGAPPLLSPLTRSMSGGKAHNTSSLPTSPIAPDVPEGEFRSELKRIRKVSMNVASKFSGSQARPRSQSFQRRVASPQLERHRETHNYKTLGKEEKFQATKMVSNDARKSATTPKEPPKVEEPAIVDSHESFKQRIDVVKTLALSKNNADVALFCDMAIKMSYRFKAVAFKDLTDLDKALVADLVLALHTYEKRLQLSSGDSGSSLPSITVDSPTPSNSSPSLTVATDASNLPSISVSGSSDAAPTPLPTSPQGLRLQTLKGLPSVPRSTSQGHFTVFGKRERPPPEVCAAQTLPHFYHDYRQHSAAASAKS